MITQLSEKIHPSEKMNLDLLSTIPKEQQDRVFNQYYCDIEPIFLGFIEAYYYLSLLIPKHWTVIDFGCAYNAQSFYFKEHKKFIAVDVPSKYLTDRFSSDNCDICITEFDAFIKNLPADFNFEETFAICNYVPINDTEFIRKAFKNIYVFYPHGTISKNIKLGKKLFV